MFERINLENLLFWVKTYWRWLLAGLVGLLVLIVTFFVILAGHQKEKTPSDFMISSQSLSSKEEPSASKYIKVDVKGAVHHPGLYQLKIGDRLEDALKRAGGITEEADVEQLNRAQLLADGMVVYVLKIGEEKLPEMKNAGTIPGNPSASDTGGVDSAKNTGKVHLNQASQKDLESLTGIGPKKAEQIIAYREQHPFKSIDELKEIPGIGPKRFEQLKDQLQL
ncbi:helix-hairpin-helix domain-containing protein [Fructobacillus durionis]|uniref:Competence protein ComEA n=1 Tax=Fructobacillus durionis TaxID=283737 RepID=A0A1I1DZY5_9LACO|nr:helix-hairpin-helix domain-containing protein [Fructobacillus durionis]SFB80619.1 competence protein ComEA [Fructobacillus durionis]